jgi:hypothetical protein
MQTVKRIYSTVLLMGLGLSPPCMAQGTNVLESTDASELKPSTSEHIIPAKHRVDASIIFYDGDQSNSLDLLLGYTYNISANLNTSLNVPLGDPDLSNAGDFGIGDSSLVISYVPFSAISANPWIPTTVGSGLGLVMPTGSAEDGSGTDTWVLGPFVGGAIPIMDHLIFLPNASYIYSLDETALDTDIRIGTFQAGLVYVTQRGFWISYTPEYLHDFELAEDFFNHDFVVGIMVTPRIGISAEYLNIERAKPASYIRINEGSDNVFQLNFHVVF